MVQTPWVPFLVGTYTERLGHVDGQGPGIVPCELNADTGALRVAGDAVPVRNPGYLWAHPAAAFVYAASEIDDFGGKPEGCVTGLEWDRRGARLTQIGQVSSGGSGPAWVRGDGSGRWLLVANYVEGNVAVLPILLDGSPGTPACAVRHEGSGPVADRQEAPHPHAFLVSPDNRCAHAADLGTDRLHGYAFDAATGMLTASPAASLRLPPGSGPRHVLFHANAGPLFVVLELSSEVAVVERNGADGSLRLRGVFSTLPAGCESRNQPSELVLSADGRFLYVANRGHDSVAIFAVDIAKGELSLLETPGCGGVIPRHMALTPDERFLLVANQDSDGVALFRRDTENGTLEPAGDPLSLPTPCFICF